MVETQLSYLVAIAGGLLSFFSPCVLPLAPGYLCFLAGVSLDEASQTSKINSPESQTLTVPPPRVRLPSVAVFFILGFSTIFIGIGAGAAAINPWLIAHSYWLTKIAGVAIFLFGVHYMGLLRLAWLNRQCSININHRDLGLFLFAYIAGLAFAFGWTPCIGPILATILIIAAGQDSLASGVSLLAAYSLGLGTPFLLAALFFPRFLGISKKVRDHLPLLRIVTGALLAATGVLIFTGGLESFAWWSLQAFPFLLNLG